MPLRHTCQEERKGNLAPGQCLPGSRPTQLWGPFQGLFNILSVFIQFHLQQQNLGLWLFPTRRKTLNTNTHFFWKEQERRWLACQVAENPWKPASMVLFKENSSQTKPLQVPNLQQLPFRGGKSFMLENQRRLIRIGYVDVQAMS